jgi:hypothetical protein
LLVEIVEDVYFFDLARRTTPPLAFVEGLPGQGTFQSCIPPVTYFVSGSVSEVR